MSKIGYLEICILSALVSGKAYGLQIINLVEERTDGKKKISIGSLYPTLYRLEKRKLIESCWGESTEEREGARRRYYELTGHGVKSLNEAQKTLQLLWKRSSVAPPVILEGKDERNKRKTIKGNT